MICYILHVKKTYSYDIIQIGLTNIKFNYNTQNYASTHTWTKPKSTNSAIQTPPTTIHLLIMHKGLSLQQILHMDT